MNTCIRLLMMLAMFAVNASAHEPRDCKASLSIADVSVAMGSEVRAQPVFADAGLKGWRIYGTRHSQQLTAKGIQEGSLMTHICGIPAREIFASRSDACCGVDASREVEVTFQIAGQDMKVLIKR